MARTEFTRCFSLFSLLCFFSFAHARALTCRQNSHLIENILEPRVTQSDDNGGPTFAIQGVGAVSGDSVHPRLEIRQLEKNPDQWNVYLLGLHRFQMINQTDKLSYFQIAGMSRSSNCRNLIPQTYDKSSDQAWNPSKCVLHNR